MAAVPGPRPRNLARPDRSARRQCETGGSGGVVLLLRFDRETEGNIERAPRGGHSMLALGPDVWLGRRRAYPHGQWVFLVGQFRHGPRRHLVVRRRHDPAADIRSGGGAAIDGGRARDLSGGLAAPVGSAGSGAELGHDRFVLIAICRSDHRDRPASHRETTTYTEPRAAYGNTETFTISTGFAHDTPQDVVANTHGEVLPGNTVKVVDPLTGALQPRGQPGEIAVKGPTLMLGYIGVPIAETLDDEGFFATGDGGYIDAKGRLVWQGRLNDIIKTGGANVSPVEVDTELAGCPGVKHSITVGRAARDIGRVGGRLRPDGGGSIPDGGHGARLLEGALGFLQGAAAGAVRGRGRPVAHRQCQGENQRAARIGGETARDHGLRLAALPIPQAAPQPRIVWLQRHQQCSRRRAGPQQSRT